MGTLLEKIEEDFRKALKSHEAARVSTLRVLMAAVKNAAIAARTSAKKVLDDADVESVIRSEIRKIKDALVDFSRAARHDLTSAAEAELKVLQSYLPAAMTNRELTDVVMKKISELKAEGEKEFGKVMKAVMDEVKGRAEGTDVAKAVKEELTKDK